MSATDLTYGSYLRLDDLLDAQTTQTDAHDELLFVIIHQTYELWFKQILHEAALLQSRLEGGECAGALAPARRIGKILKTVVGQLDILETMTPGGFTSFRSELGSSSGFQSYQFRYIEAVVGRRDFSAGARDDSLSAIVSRRSVFDSFLQCLALQGWPIPADVLSRDVTQEWEGDERVQRVLIDLYRREGSVEAGLAEALVDIDEGLQEWRYRHVKMVERIIGAKIGTGGSAGAAYLRSTLFRPAFPDLWEIRSEL
ncbi:tryptophan 2,3-dioxygenase family protein [Nocardioides sp. LHD-245]|uniref:tryptophan 2,3-dioxygenase n=1 Tax=Nocardioides sp. LHD-245 TaxID=3051387 RepID=UPI0027E0727D|nr:tryptophan 2,3-dioxygenase family protein [Nocardioides sp. LHD-245]